MKTKHKDYNYFEAFEQSASFSLDCSRVLKNAVAVYDIATLSEKVKQLHKIEHSGDIAKHEMMEHLLKDFLPPLEREDIIQLAQEIDSVTDSVEDIIIKLDMFRVDSIHQDALPFLELIEKCCEAMCDAIKEFSNYRKSSELKQKIIELNRLEEVGDDLYMQTIKNLYATEKDPVKLMIWTEIYRCFETCCDKCEDVADVIETVVLKNS